MRFSSSFSILVGVSLAAAFTGLQKRTNKAEEVNAKKSLKRQLFTHEAPRAVKTSQYLTPKSAKFAVNGTSLPEIDFNIGESYAGSLPISSNPDDVNKLWFWFFPSSNPNATKEITIWLNGGPGCSSLIGLLDENGPFTWQSGTYAPIQNQYSYLNLTNMVWIDQPVGVGFSTGNITTNNEQDVATQFNGFWKNFIETFSMQGYKVYITGESYAGQYIPYIANDMLDRNDTSLYNLKGIQVIDGYFANPNLYSFTIPFINKYSNVMQINDSYVETLTNLSETCGITDYYNTYINQFPPSGPFPDPPPYTPECDIWDFAYGAALYVNPCFNVYHVTDSCPYLWDEMGFPSLGGGPSNYFNRTDVRAILHTEGQQFTECDNPAGLFPNGDLSDPSSYGTIASVIDRTQNVIIAHGLLDFLLPADSNIVAIQNMTWGGKQGFQEAPSTSKNFFVPYHQWLAELYTGGYPTPYVWDAGAGLQGTTHTERGLTWVTVDLSGHEIPQYVPGAAYRQLEFLLGRISSLEEISDYTTLPGNFYG